MGQQTLVILLAHLQQQAQLGDIAEQTIAGAIGWLQQQVLVVLGAIAAAGLLIGIQPVKQAFGIGRFNLQQTQQAAELGHGGLVGLALAQQAVEVKARAQITDLGTQLAALVQSETGQGPGPGLTQMIQRRARIAGGQVALQHRLGQHFTAQGIVQGLAHMQLVGAAADRQLLASNDPSADHGHHHHHQQHGDQGHALLAPHNCGSGSGAGCSGFSAPSSGARVSCSGSTSGRRSRRRS